MRQKVVLVTGANGEIDHGLINHLAKLEKNIVALEVVPLDKALRPLCTTYIVGDILDQMLLGRLVVEHEIATIYHLASILSTKAEYNPETAHRINVEGTLNLLRLAVEQSQWQGNSVKFIYPSSIAAYGIPTTKEKALAGAAKEREWATPTTMYGCNKLYCEHLGRYYNSYYRQLAADCGGSETVDFRAIRFPGLISAETTPTGGTSDYAPEMIHASAKGEEYNCFVQPDTIIPFMVMPDAIKALVTLEAVSRKRLSQFVYNVTSFSLSAQEIFDIVLRAFPDAKIHFAVDECRQKIVDSWPKQMDDSAARKDWDWEPDYNCERSFYEYLIPAIRERYQGTVK
jgi:nucleoside-diphosphate-sugar epimerase